MKQFDTLVESILNENSTDDAAGTLKAVIGALKKRDLDDKGKEVLKTAEGIMDYYKKEGSFSPGQAKAIFNMSKLLN